MGNKEGIILCTDDIRPGTVKAYWKVWSLLKSNHPNLKLNAFVIPYYFEEDPEHILSKEFVEWYASVKHWVDLHLHGFTHSFPPECLLANIEQAELIEKGARLLGMLCKRDFGFKAPGYHYNIDTVDILRRLQIKFLCNEKEIIWMRNVEIKNGFKDCILLQTHTNGISTDSVEKIYETLNEFFKDKEFVFINELII